MFGITTDLEARAATVAGDASTKGKADAASENNETNMVSTLRRVRCRNTRIYTHFLLGIQIYARQEFLIL